MSSARSCFSTAINETARVWVLRGLPEKHRGYRRYAEAENSTEMGLKILENLTQQAFRYIRDDIVQGKFDGRQHLTERYLAERFGMSKVPIREALNHLESEGLITLIS